MNAGGATVTCLPVCIDEGDDQSNREGQWQAAIFFRLGGRESQGDIEILQNKKAAFAVGMETDIIEHANASVVVLRVQLYTQPDDPLVGEVLLTPGGAETHYEVLGLLSQQQTLSWFCADQDYHLLHQQRQELSQAWRDEFLALRTESFKRDAVLRLAGKYNAQTAFAEIVSNYAIR